jgi:2-polyprenyl-3-methyl-5-hydroxy-6-metoxy-1,4-benzoquinol methylase
MQKLLGSDYFDKDYFDNPKSNKSNYDRITGGYREKIFRPFKVQQATQIMKYLGYTSRWKPDSVLVVGCAKGLLVRMIQKMGVKCEGIDISEYAIKESKKYTENCKVGNVCDMNEYKNNQFEVVICLETLEHIPQPYLENALDEMCRVAQRYIVISTPDGTIEGEEKSDPSHFSVYPPKYWVGELIKRRFMKTYEHMAGSKFGQYYYLFTRRI